jgi:hypothetical protein
VSSRLGHAFLVLVALAGALGARATVLVMPAQFENFGPNEPRSQVNQALRNVLQSRLLTPTSSSLPGGCQQVQRTPACLKAAAEATGADEVAIISLKYVDEKRGDVYATAEVDVFDSEGKSVLTLRSPLTVSSASAELERMFMQAFRPTAFAGTVSITGLADGEHALVDGMPVSGGLETLSVGEHEVTVRGADGRVRTQSVAIAYKTQATVDMSSGPAPEVSSRAIWPFVVAAVTAGLGVALVPAAISLTFYDRHQEEVLRELAASPEKDSKPNVQPAIRDDPLGGGWKEGYGEKAKTGVSSAGQLRWRANLMNGAEANKAAADWLWVAAVTGGVIAAGAGGAAWVLRPGADDAAE